MSKKILLFSISTLFFQVLSSQFQDRLLLNQVLLQLNIKESEINMELGQDKVLPYSTEKTVLVIPKYTIHETEGHDYAVMDSYIVVAENRTGKILHQFYESDAWVSDAVVLSDIEIDTALYHLNSITRAFGVRVSYIGISRPNPYNRTELSLYIPDDVSLKRVLKNFKINNYNGEWDTNCAGESTERRSFITFDKNKTTNFQDLIIKTKIINRVTHTTDEDCVEKSKISTSKIRLKYNGSTYK